MTLGRHARTTVTFSGVGSPGMSLDVLSAINPHAYSLRLPIDHVHIGECFYTKHAKLLLVVQNNKAVYAILCLWPIYYIETLFCLPSCDGK